MHANQPCDCNPAPPVLNHASNRLLRKAAESRRRVAASREQTEPGKDGAALSLTNKISVAKHRLQPGSDQPAITALRAAAPLHCPGPPSSSRHRGTPQGNPPPASSGQSSASLEFSPLAPLPSPGDRGQLRIPCSAPPLPPAPVPQQPPPLFPANAEAGSPLSCGQQRGSLPRASSSSATGRTDRRGGRRMENASLAGLSPGARFCAPAQAGDEATAVLTAQQEFDPTPGPFGLQSSPFLILATPAQPRGMWAGMALAGAMAAGCFAGTPSKGRGSAGTPPAPSPAPPDQRGSASCCWRVMEGTWGICGRRLFLPRSLSQVFPVQKLPGTGQAVGEEAFLVEKGGRKDFPLPGWPGWFHPPSQLSSTRCRPGTCHKFS